MKITIGTRFRYSYADANPEWEVRKARGGNTWDCVIVDCPDYSGTKKVFSAEEIKACLGMQAMWKKVGDESKDFYQRLTAGSIVHYSNGHNCYVRCKVNDKKELVPLALVGEWRDYDLPKHDECGNVILGYHAENIKNGKPMTPHASNIYEFQITRKPASQPIGFNQSKNPSQMAPISLEPKPMTPEQAANAPYWRQVYHIQSLTNADRQNPKAVVDSIRKYLELV